MAKKLSKFKHNIIEDYEDILKSNKDSRGSIFILFLKFVRRVFIGGVNSWKEHVYVISYHPHPLFLISRLCMVMFFIFATFISLLSLYVILSVEALPITKQTWGFDSPDEYIFDSDKVEFVDGHVRTKLSDFSKSSESAFAKGEFIGTEFIEEKGVLQLSQDGMLRGSGVYTSEVLDSSDQSAEWESLEIHLTRPIRSHLPFEGQKDDRFDEGQIDMSANSMYLDGDFFTSQSGQEIFIDKSGKGNSAYATGIFPTVSDQLGDILSFDGQDDYLKVFPYKEFPADRFTIAFWIRTTAENQTILSYASEENKNDVLIVNPANLVIYVAGKKVETGVKINDDTWHHVAVAWQADTGNLRLLIDGFPFFSEIIQRGKYIGTNGSLVIGERQTEVGGVFLDGQAFIGRLDQVVIFGDSLQTREINTIFRRFSEDVKVQVRVCSEPMCKNVEFFGPNGVGSYFIPEYFGNGKYGVNLDVSGRYIQYKLRLETMDSGFSQEIKELSLLPNYYPADKPSVQNRNPIVFEKINGIQAEGDIGIQLSTNGRDWYFFDGDDWSLAKDSSDVASVELTNSNIDSFDQFGGLFFKAFLLGGLSSQADLDYIYVAYDEHKINTFFDDFPDPEVPIIEYQQMLFSRTVLALLLGVFLLSFVAWNYYVYYIKFVLPPFLRDQSKESTSDHPLMSEFFDANMNNISISNEEYLVAIGIIYAGICLIAIIEGVFLML